MFGVTLLLKIEADQWRSVDNGLEIALITLEASSLTVEV
jgi:hypothetical protein